MPGSLGRRHLLRHAAAAGLLAALPARAQDAPVPGFLRITPPDGRETVWIAPAQVIRIGQVEAYTVLDTAAWVQQRTTESVEAIARRLADTGLRLVPLTDLNGRRIWLAADRIVAVRESGARHAAGARAAIIMVGLRFNTDIAVREGVEEVMEALRRVPGTPPAERPG